MVALVWFCEWLTLFQFHAVSSHLLTKKGLHDLSLVKKTQKTASSNAHLSLHLPLVLRGCWHSRCRPLWSITISSHNSPICPYMRQCHYRFTGREQLLQGENMSFSPYYPSLYQRHLYWQLEVLISTLGKGVDSIGHRRQGVISHFTQLLICMEWLWASDIQHPMIWTHNPLE